MLAARAPMPTASSIAATRASASGPRTPISASGSATFCAAREIGQHVKRLEHESHPLAAKAGERVVVERREIGAVDEDLAAVGPVESGDEVEQRRLADAGLAHDADELATCDLEVEAPQYGQPARAGEGLADGAKGEHGGCDAAETGTWRQE